jgi:hypothetical protein
MSVNPIQLFESRTLLLKVEATAGTDPTPTGAANAVVSMEGSCKVLADKLERKLDRAFFGANPYVLVGKRCEIEFDFDLIGASGVGTAAPCGPILVTCGMSEALVAATSATYKVVSSGFSTATIYFYHAGLLFAVNYCVGTLDIDFTAKQWPKAHAKYIGTISLAAPTEVAAPAVTVTAFQRPPAVETETFVLNCNAVALNATAFKLTQGNKVNIFEGSEARQVSITQRDVSGTFTIYQEVLGTFNPWSIANSFAPVALYSEVGTVAGKIVRVTAAQAQLMYPDVGNDNGAATWAIPYSGLPSSTGNDDLAIKFT